MRLFNSSHLLYLSFQFLIFFMMIFWVFDLIQSSRLFSILNKSFVPEKLLNLVLHAFDHFFLLFNQLFIIQYHSHTAFIQVLSLNRWLMTIPKEGSNKLDDSSWRLNLRKLSRSWLGWFLAEAIATAMGQYLSESLVLL